MAKALDYVYSQRGGGLESRQLLPRRKEFYPESLVSLPQEKA